MVTVAVNTRSPYGTVSRVFAGATIVCAATGASLTLADVEYCRDRARLIAIKQVFHLAPWADVVYSAGYDRSQWWQHNARRVTTDALRFTLDPEARDLATILRIGPKTGLSLQPDTLAYGQHSGYSAINLAVLLGASKIVLLGYDMQPGPEHHHFYGLKPAGTHPDYAAWIPHYDTLVAPLKAAGVSVINASRASAITAFRRMPIEEALA